MILFRSLWAVIVGLLSLRAASAPALGCAAKITRRASRRSALPFAPVEGSRRGGSIGVRRRCRRIHSFAQEPGSSQQAGAAGAAAAGAALPETPGDEET